MKKTIMMLLMSAYSSNVFAGVPIDFKGVQNRKDKSMIAAVCGENGLPAERCQFVEIPANADFAETFLANGKDFNMEETAKIIETVVKPKLKYSKKPKYQVTKAFFHQMGEGPDGEAEITSAARGLRSIFMVPTFGLATFILESVYEGGRRVVIALIKDEKAEEVDFKVVTLSNYRYESLREAINQLK